MNTTKSFTGINVYTVEEIATVEHIKISKNWLTRKTKTRNLRLEDAYRSSIVVATDKIGAIEKHIARYKTWKVGDKVDGWLGYRNFPNSIITSTQFKVEVTNVTAEKLFKESNVEDYVEYMKYLEKGFDELIVPTFIDKED